MTLSRQFIFFVLFQPNTAYEMRISDWSSDVCSSDLQPQSQRNDRAAPDGDDHRASEIYDGYALQHACPPQLIPIESRPQAPVERDADREEQRPAPGNRTPGHLPPQTSIESQRCRDADNEQKYREDDNAERKRNGREWGRARGSWYV